MADTQTEGGNIVSGARAIFALSSQIIGWARNLSMTESIEYIPVEVLNNIEVAHHVPIAYRVSMTASFIRILGSSFKTLGFVPKVGVDPTAHIRNILNLADLTASVTDTVSNTVMQTITNVRVGDTSLSVDARGLMGHDCSLVGIRALDEGEV
ncbi:MAG: hypothetical protein EOO40_00525 [Deltaproteobacteria bacterium]|nr:MAG: hypothetical protein EOO40_00525 [Deltaproteobacteria bacterium]